MSKMRTSPTAKAFSIFAVAFSVFALVYSLWANKVTNEPVKLPAMPPATGTIIRKEFIPSHWFTHVIEDAKGRRIVQDFAPDQWIINVTLTTGQPYRFNVNEAGYDTLHLNNRWTNK